MSAARDIRQAFGLLTVVPFAVEGDRPTPRVVAWFPWVGLVLGAFALVPLTVLNAINVASSDGRLLTRAAWPLAVLVVGGWAIATRLLHWDGLADVADAWWGGHSAERRLEIMADSSVGAFGATACALVVLAQVAAVAVLLGRPGMGIALFAAPVFGRAAAMFGAWLGAPARPGGLGASVIGTPDAAGIVIAAFGMSLAGASMLYEHGAAGLWWSVVGVVVAAAVPHLLSQRFGGVTGDVLGASVIVTETVILFGAAMVVSW